MPTYRSTLTIVFSPFGILLHETEIAEFRVLIDSRENFSSVAGKWP